VGEFQLTPNEQFAVHARLVGDRLELRVPYGRVAYFVVGVLLAFVLAGWGVAVLASGSDGGTRINGFDLPPVATGVALLGMALWAGTWSALGLRSKVVAAPEGLIVPRLVRRETVPWSGVERVVCETWKPSGWYVGGSGINPDGLFGWSWTPPVSGPVIVCRSGRRRLDMLATSDGTDPGKPPMMRTALLERYRVMLAQPAAP
jgi:hypothetical protein